MPLVRGAGGAGTELFLERPAGNEAGESLVVLAVAVRLPPVDVLLADDVQDVALLERDAELATRNVQVVFGVVVEQRLHVNLPTTRASI